MARLATLAAAMAAVASGIEVTPLVIAAKPTYPVINVDLSTTYQQFDGMGISEAFQRGRIIKGLAGLQPRQTNLVLDLLFSNTTGAGLTILRNGIGSSPAEPYDHMESICPVAPASNSSALNFVSLASLRNDQQQVWLSHQFKNRGGRFIYADAWSADGYMKTNGMDIYGGYICGVTGTNCSTGDWRQAYADKIVHFIQDYERQGITIDYVGFLNEPDYTSPYASMNSDGQQAADFLMVLAPTLKKAGLTTKMTCCDSTGWAAQAERLADLQAAGAGDIISLVTSHGYSGVGGPFNTTHPTWLTEWATFDAFDPSWYSYGGDAEGLTWANHIQSGFANTNLSAFVYWWGAANDSDNEPLIHIPNNEVIVSKRLWAMAHWGRLVQYGARRNAATVTQYGSSVINATSFVNPDGSVSIQIINNTPNDTTIALTGAMPTRHASIITYLTNNAEDFTPIVPVNITGSALNTTIPANSLLSFVISATK